MSSIDTQKHDSANNLITMSMPRKSNEKVDHHCKNNSFDKHKHQNHSKRERSSDTMLDLAKLGHDDNAELRKALIPLINNMLPGWGNVSERHIQLERVSGALTNAVFFVTNKLSQVKNTKPLKVVLRVYGNGVDQLFDRERELHFLEKLSRLRIGPELLGTFKNGRFEQYLESTTLSRDDLRIPDTSRTIAQRMFQLHNIVNIFPPPQEGFVPEVWANIDKWYPLARSTIYSEKQKDELREFGFELLGNEIEELKIKLAKLNSPIVFAHNDTQYGNVLRLTDGSVVVVDFEYAGYNYRGFDISNHFCEWMFDYHSSESHKMHSDWYPTDEQQINFLQSYIQSERDLTGDSSSLQILKTEANAFALASHVMWGLWGLIQSGQSDIEFDYFGYGLQRLKFFRSSKNTILNSL